MRILLTTDAVGGVWRYTIDLAHGMRARGADPVIAVLGPAPTPNQQTEATPVPLFDTGLPLDWTAAEPAALAHATSALQALARRLGTDTVQLHAPALAGGRRWDLPIIAVTHSCVATWWHAVRGGPLPDDLAWRADATGIGLGTADAVVAPTQAHADASVAAYGPLDIRVIHNGAATLTPTLSRQRERERAVLTAGRLWDDGKNAAALNRAAPLLDAPIRAAGPVRGPNGATIELPHLHLLGTLDAAGMRAAYEGATVFASLARYEPFGLSVLEAAQAGLRLVLSDIPSFRELWDGAALFVADESDLIQALRHALDHESDAAALRAQRYTLDATVTRTLAQHARLIARVPCA